MMGQRRTAPEHPSVPARSSTGVTHTLSRHLPRLRTPSALHKSAQPTQMFLSSVSPPAYGTTDSAGVCMGIVSRLTARHLGAAQMPYGLKQQLWLSAVQRMERRQKSLVKWAGLGVVLPE